MEFLIWLVAVLGCTVVAVATIFSLDALGLLHSQAVGGFVGIGLGVLCLIGGFVAMDRFA